MTFGDQLRRICERVPGCLGATLMGFDGIPIDIVETPLASERAGFDLQAVTVEYSVALATLMRAAQNLGDEPLGEFSVQAGDLVTLFRVLNDEYFLALVMLAPGRAPHGVYPIVGRARYALKAHAAPIVAALEE
jgi:hypothetical protein